MREVRGLTDAGGLLEVAAFVGGDDFEAGADAEANSGDEGIRESDAVHIVSVSLLHRTADRLIAGKETIENLRSDVGRRLNF